VGWDFFSQERGIAGGDWRLSGCVDILADEMSRREKQIPHPAKTAGIRDDNCGGTAGIRDDNHAGRDSGKRINRAT
jgi:hypothetical protein